MQVVLGYYREVIVSNSFFPLLRHKSFVLTSIGCFIDNVLSICNFKNFGGKPRNAKGDNASQHCEILLLDACNKLSDSSYLSTKTMTADDVTR